jgi:phosphoadenosine phosphosulfate reductase
MIKTALQFSGGKDSLALLHLWREKLDRTLVCWVNTGAAYPETIQQMQKVRDSVPNFLEINSDQPKDVKTNGFPTDLVPLHFTPQGRSAVFTGLHYRMQDTFSCCSTNIWQPLHQAVVERGITTVLRGQKNVDTYKAPFRSGYSEDGVTYLFPLEDWTDAEVFDYLKQNNVPLPLHYTQGEKKSHDCWNCTGYLDEDAGRIGNLPPDQQNEVINRLIEIDEAIHFAKCPLRGILNKPHYRNRTKTWEFGI